MQCFKLVSGGFVDKVIVFDSLPERLMQGVKTRDVAGFPRRWATWLVEIGCTRPVYKTETTQHPDRSYSFKYTPIGKEPCFFVLEYKDINADKEKWAQISEYVRTSVDPNVRLREKLEDMAVALAANPTLPLELEPEDIVPIVIPDEVTAPVSEMIADGESYIVNEAAAVPKKKMGRPKKVAVA